MQVSDKELWNWKCNQFLWCSSKYVIQYQPSIIVNIQDPGGERGRNNYHRFKDKRSTNGEFMIGSFNLILQQNVYSLFTIKHWLTWFRETLHGQAGCSLRQAVKVVFNPFWRPTNPWLSATNQLQCSRVEWPSISDHRLHLLLHWVCFFCFNLDLVDEKMTQCLNLKVIP